MMDARPRWYRGDCHAHTNCSDGFYSPPQLVELAKTEGLDFLAITDHNTIDAFSKIEDDPGLLILRGMGSRLRVDWVMRLWIWKIS
jgi:histidinol phosphatase-like PHP family hydrolase